MKTTNPKRGKGLIYTKTLAGGLVSALLFGALLSQQDLISYYFARGGVYAVLPVLTAFLFSFVHGSFTGNFWTALGVEASKKRGE